MKMSYVDALPERAETLSGVLDHGFELYARSFKDAAILIAVGAVPGAIFGFFLAQSSAAAFLGSLKFGALFRNYWWAFPIWLGAVWFTCCCYAATIYSIGLRARGQSLRWKPALRRGMQVGVKLLLLTLLSLLIFALAIAACGVWVYAVGHQLVQWVSQFSGSPIFGPLFQALSVVVMVAPLVVIIGFFSVPILLAPCTMVLLNQGVFSSIGSGFMLMGQHFWRSVLVFSVPGILLIIASTALNVATVLVLLLGGGEGKFWYELIAQLLAIALQALLMPMLIAASIAHFSDLLIRREGRDLQLQLDALS